MNGVGLEVLDNGCDDGTINENVYDFASSVIGHKIVSAVQTGSVFTVTLDDGTSVELEDTGDCCAYTELTAFLAHPEMVEHVITGVYTTDDATNWHVCADMGDVLELTVGWSAGNPFYYSYGFNIKVRYTS